MPKDKDCLHRAEGGQSLENSLVQRREGEETFCVLEEGLQEETGTPVMWSATWRMVASKLHEAADGRERKKSLCSSLLGAVAKDSGQTTKKRWQEKLSKELTVGGKKGGRRTDNPETSSERGWETRGLEGSI